MNDSESALAVRMGVEMMRTKACQAVMDLVSDQKAKGANMETIRAILEVYLHINSVQF